MQVKLSTSFVKTIFLNYGRQTVLFWKVPLPTVWPKYINTATASIFLSSRGVFRTLSNT